MPLIMSNVPLIYLGTMAVGLQVRLAHELIAVAPTIWLCYDYPLAWNSRRLASHQLRQLWLIHDPAVALFSLPTSDGLTISLGLITK